MFGKKKEPSRTPAGAAGFSCSFCNKSQRDVRKLIAGPNVHICDECVDICLDIISHEETELARSSDIEGRVEPSGRAWQVAGTLLFCGLCRIPTSLDQSLAVPDRGIICAGCVGALQAALAERNESN